MSRKFLTPIDLAKNELQNATVGNLAAAPSSPVKGLLYFNSTDNTLYWYNGSAWVAAQGGAGATPATTVTTQAVGDAAVVGTTTNFAREDHKHGMPAFGSVTAQTSFGAASSSGASASIARTDHAHGTPAHLTADHSAVLLSGLAAPTASVNMNNQLVTNVATPVSATDATNKSYVDNAVAGLSWKDTVRAATTANIALSAPQTIDGVSVIANDRVLVKNQTTQSGNGIYLVAAGAWTRATDADVAAELEGAAVYVGEGTTQADTAWVMTTNAPLTVGTTSLVWVQFAGGGTVVGGAGLTMTGNTLDVGAGTGVSVAADTVALDLTYTDGRYDRKFALAVGGAVSSVVTHNLNSRDVVVDVYRVATPFDSVECDVERTDANNVTLRFSAAPSAGEYRCVVVG